MARETDNRIDGERQTQEGVQGAHGGETRNPPQLKDQDDKSDKGGQIAQDRQQTTGLGGMS